VKLATQLFGDRMIIANATGCSSIWGGSAPTCPYTTNSKGHGPAWANSLFEDNAEFGFGIAMGVEERRSQLADILSALKEEAVSDSLKEAIGPWLEQKEDAEGSRQYGDKIKELLPREQVSGKAKELVDKAIRFADQLTKKSVWIIGGDGWAYDIGFGGLDHVLASGADVNVLVLDTEVYSNTGGQSSKATPTGAVAKFAASGKKTRKKDLGLMAMSYGYVYVASVSMGSNPNHVVKVMSEAEAYNGPSLIIAYAPCINHGINMGRSLAEAKRAVEAGYWPLYRYNPTLAEAGKNPFTLDSKEPTGDFREFLMGQVRYTSLKKQFPDTADELYTKAEQDAKLRLAAYRRLAQTD
jgi:pyruvate-ferredoxin/flavodoxin oxidoreductase